MILTAWVMVAQDSVQYDQRSRPQRGTNTSGAVLFLEHGYAAITNAAAGFRYNRTNTTLYAAHFVGDGSGLTGVSGSGGGDPVGSNYFYAQLHPYVPPSISVFQNDQNSVEIGSTVTSTILNWTLAGATVSTQNLNQSIGSIGAVLRRWTNSASYSVDRTYTLTVGDGTNSAAANSSVTFLSKRYWGVSANATLTDGQIIALAGSELSTSFSQSRSLSPSAQYIYFAFPASFGAPSFTVNGLPNTAWTLVTRAFVNASGASVSYRIYRSDNLLTGTFTVAL